MATYTRNQIERMAEDDMKNFNDLDLSGCDLSGLEFTQKPFKRAILRGANLSGATFTQCEFKKADLRGASLLKTQFDQCEFPEAVFDEAIVEQAAFCQCDFKRATWNGSKVKKTEFSQCDNLVGLPVEKIYQSLWDMDDDRQKREVCRARLQVLEPVVGGQIKERKDESEIQFVGAFQGRAFRVLLDMDFGQPSVQLVAKNRLGGLRLFRDPGKKTKAAAPDQWDQMDQVPVHFFLSDSVFLEEFSAEMEWTKKRLEMLPEPIYNGFMALLEQLKLTSIELADEWIEARFKKDILQLNLAESVPMILAVFGQLAPVLEAAQPVGPVLSFAEMTGAAGVCRYCANAVPWGQIRCPSCGASL